MIGPPIGVGSGASAQASPCIKAALNTVCVKMSVHES